MTDPKTPGVDSTDDLRPRLIERRLRVAYGRPRHFNPSDPLDDLIFLVLSRMTQETKYLRTYRRLRRSLPTWSAVRAAPSSRLETLLDEAGLARTKATQIRGLLAEIDAREGCLSLARLRPMPDDEVERYLTTLPGVGRKTALCVMLYTLNRGVLPVDTHVWRIAQRLGLAPRGPWSEPRGRDLEARIPTDLRPSLHVTLVAHGREVCRASRPRCDTCILADLCPTAHS